MLREHEIKHIQQSVSKLKEDLCITKYPINMIDVFRTHFKDTVILCSMPVDEEKADVDVVVNYNEQYDKHIIVINQNRIVPSLMKRLNFSLAHELGHIALEHHTIKKKVENYNWENYGSEDDEDGGIVEYYSDNPGLMDAEANEFAGQFLVSNEILKKCNRKAIVYLTDYFFVSQKCLNVRFDVLDRLAPMKAPRIPNRIYKFNDIFTDSVKSIMNN